MSVRMERAREAWGDVPDFVAVIIRACDAPGSSQNKIAAKIGYTGAVISQVISHKYPGDLQRIADQVRIVLMQSTVECPALGKIREAECVAWKDRAERLTSASPTTVRMFRACRGCPRFTGDQP